MAKTEYFERCVDEIRHTTYGRDNRKLIADAILKVKAEDYHVKKLTRVTVEQMVISGDPNTYYRMVIHQNGH